MNAVILAHGLTIGGRESARQALAHFWETVANRMPINPRQGSLFLDLTRILSPYQLNPFELNPLRDIVTDLVDFERLRTGDRIKLFVAATQVRTGKLRLFKTEELSADALLASAALPSLHPAVEIEGEPYWDGGFSANPAIFPLLYHCESPDVIVVLLPPLTRPDTPITAATIGNRVTELSVSTTFLREMCAIGYAQDQVEKELPFGRLERRLDGMRFHLIGAEELMSELSMESKFNTHLSFLTVLRDHGRARAALSLARNSDGTELRSSVNLAELFC